MSQSPPPLPKVYHLRRGWRAFLIGSILFPIIVVFILLCLGLGWALAQRASAPENFARLLALLPVLLVLLSLPMLLLGFMEFLLVQLLHASLELTHEGILWQSAGLSIYTPWTNIAAICTQRRGRLTMSGLQLAQPARHVRQITRAHLASPAVFTRAWYVFSLSPDFSSFLPISSVFVPGGWEHSELGAYIHFYAPQLLQRHPE